MWCYKFGLIFSFIYLCNFLRSSLTMNQDATASQRPQQEWQAT